MNIIASVDVGILPSITQYWELWNFPENPYIVLREYKVDEKNYETRLYLSTKQIKPDPSGNRELYFYQGTLSNSETRDEEI